MEVERGVEAERVAAVVLDMVVADEDEVVDELLLILCVCVCVLIAFFLVNTSSKPQEKE